jgi:7-cyano-7-deazaguanine synthase
MNKLLAGYTQGNVVLEAPFINWNKKMIYHYCKENNVPTDLTYSCENGTIPPCGKCNSCLDRRYLHAD